MKLKEKIERLRSGLLDLVSVAALEQPGGVTLYHTGRMSRKSIRTKVEHEGTDGHVVVEILRGRERIAFTTKRKDGKSGSLRDQRDRAVAFVAAAIAEDVLADA